MPERFQVPYAVNEPDFRSALRHYRISAVKRFVKYFPIFAAMFAVFDVASLEYRDYLFPLAVIAIGGSAITTIIFTSGLWWTWACSRVLRRHPLVFRGPVEKIDGTGGLVFVPRFLDKGADGSPVMKARDPVKPRNSRRGWPQGIEDGVWFAGDDPFGGVALVRGSGELLFMQPQEWKLAAEERLNSGPERIKRARRAGIKWGRYIR